MGVRESPTRDDYVRFLQELRAEAGDQMLNPNELRAVVSIVHVMHITQCAALRCVVVCDLIELQYVTLPSHDTAGAEAGAGVFGSRTAGPLFVPDDRSVLRLASDCVVF